MSERPQTLKGRWAPVLARLAGAAVLMTVLAGPLQPWLVRQLAPAWVGAIEGLAPEFKVAALNTQGPAGGTVHAQLVLVGSVFVGQRVIVPEAQSLVGAQTPGGVTWSALMLFVVVLAAWPRRMAGLQRLWRALIGAVLLVPLLVLEVPVMLVGAIFNGLYAELAPLERNGWMHLAAVFRGGLHFLWPLAIAVLVAEWHRGREGSDGTLLNP